MKEGAIPVTRRGDWMRKSIDRRTLAAAFTTSLPIMITFVVLGTGYGPVLMAGLTALRTRQQGA